MKKKTDMLNSEPPPAIVAILVAQSVKAGASIAEIARATGRPTREITQMLETVDLLEQLIAHETLENPLRTSHRPKANTAPGKRTRSTHD